MFFKKNKPLKNIITSLLIFCFIALQTNAISLANDLSKITAKSAILIEASTGRILYNKNANEKNYPASTTKMMTLIIALENGDIRQMATASKEAAFTEGSSLGLEVDEKMPMIDLLYGLILISGNDAAKTIAETISGSDENFVKLMNEKALSIGAKNTHFANPHGLHDENHYTTASDLALIASYGYKNPLFTHIISTIKREMPYRPKEGDREIYNKNNLLYYYEGANGVKTGYTDTAGQCLVAGVKRNNLQLISVVLNSEDIWEDSKILLAYGFSQIKPYEIAKKDTPIDKVPVFFGNSSEVEIVPAFDIIIPILNEKEKDEIIINKDLPFFLFGSVNKGEKIGTITVTTKDKQIIKADLIAKEEITNIFSIKRITNLFS